MNTLFLPYNLHRHLSPKHVHLLVAPDARQAEYWYENLKYWLNDRQHLYWFSDWETLPYDRYTPHPDLVAERLRVLAELPTRKYGVVVVSATALRQRLCPQSYPDKYGIHLAVNDRLNRDAFIRRLHHAGYVKTAHLAGKGEYAARGNLVDVFPLNAVNPIRLEWFDEHISSIRTFAADTGLTLTCVSGISILPCSEIDTSEAGRTCFRQSSRALFGESIIECPLYRQISNGNTVQGAEYYLPLFFDETATLFDYLPENTRQICCDNLTQALQQHDDYCRKRYQRCLPLRENILLPPEALWLSPEAVSQALARLPQHTYPEKAQAVIFSGNTATREARWLGLLEESPRCVIHFTGNGAREQWHERLIKTVPELRLSDDSRETAARLTLTLSPNQHSFRDEDTLHLSEADLHTVPPPINYRQSRQHDPATLIRSLQDLTPGTPVVHTDYGIGRYRGLQTLEAGGEELMTIEYAKGAKLYVPVSDTDLISKYNSADPDNAPLHELGGKAWRNSRQKVRQNLRDTAAELLALYAKREAAEGIRIPVAADAMTEFAAGFPYEETPDQQAAIAAILQDLAKPQPMDRIVCGDVGFGKTEVAIRAIYATVLAGYQVALIAPTTLLADQHYHNMSDRFADYPVRIDSVSRFKSAAAAGETLKQVKEGKIDLIIGTHRLLQKDVAFHNLGLVIIDEEQRFGVRHKEKLKSLRANTNLLTLTATPIPRTLNLALNGLRDLSIIATAPMGRQNIQTILGEWDLEIFEEACEREYRRGGQTYFLHNDIDSIERIARMLQDMLPEQRIGIAHGRMRERELEHIMQNFQNRHYDILVATTIIESGIDIPNANTIIINRADKLGLSQLHQLRGRVGRSHHQAYAYLITPHWNSLGKDAQRRLEAFTTLDSLGAGFLLAGQDLEIRGAGEILGDEQSGQIQQIGISYYLDLLERTIEALKNGQSGETDFEAERIQVNFPVPALLPDTYIYDPQERLVIYQRLAQSKTDEELNAVYSELTDRFGKMPPPAKYLISRTRVKQKAAALGIKELTLSDTEIRLTFRPNAPFNPEPLFALMQKYPQKYRMLSPTGVKILCPDTSFAENLEHTEQLLEQLRR